MSGHDHADDGHPHARDHGEGGHDHAAASQRALAAALAINTAFLVVEVAGALLADSLALLADAVHMLTDSASLGLALFAAWVATRPADANRTYGYHRAEVIGALVNGLLLVGAVGYVLGGSVRPSRQHPAERSALVDGQHRKATGRVGQALESPVGTGGEPVCLSSGVFHVFGIWERVVLEEATREALTIAPPRR